jgi:hypothetical protein
MTSTGQSARPSSSPISRALTGAATRKGRTAAHHTAPPGPASPELPPAPSSSGSRERDHRNSGARWTCSISEEGPGVVFWHPRGLGAVQGLINYIRRRQSAAGYREVNSPQVPTSRCGRPRATGSGTASTCSALSPRTSESLPSSR